MQKIKHLLCVRWISLVIGIILVLAIAGLAYAVNYTLNQQVVLHVTVNPTTTPPPSIPTTTYVYQDSSLSNPLSDIYFGYDQGGTDTFVGFVPADITSLGINTLTLPLEFEVAVTLGEVSGIYRPVTITVSGGEASTSPYEGTGVFTGS